MMMGRQRILDWLMPADYDRKQQEFARIRVPGTGEWLLDRKEYQDWLKRGSSPAVLWCSGKPGAGKSMLT